MSQFSVYVSLPDYLHQWLRHEFWDEDTGRVVFPQGSAPRAVLQSLLRPKPRDWQQEDTTGMLRIEVPSVKGVNPATFNYLSAHGQAALTSACKSLFRSVLWLELNPLFPHDVQITEVVYDFMDRHGIERTERNWEAIRQMYSRMRKKTFKRL